MGNKHSIGYQKLTPTTNYDYDEHKQHQQPLLLHTPVDQFPGNREIGKLMKKNAELEKKLKDMSTTVDQLKAAVAASSNKPNVHKEDMEKFEKKNADLEKKVIAMAAEVEKLKAASSNFSKKEDVEKLTKKNANLEKQVAEMSTANTMKTSAAAATKSDNKEDMIIVAQSNSGVGQITTIDPFITFNDDLLLPEPQPQTEDCERRDIFGCLILVVFLICVLIGISLPC